MNFAQKESSYLEERKSSWILGKGKVDVVLRVSRSKDFSGERWSFHSIYKTHKLEEMSTSMPQLYIKKQKNDETIFPLAWNMFTDD